VTYLAYLEETMAKENTEPKPAGALTGGSEKNRSAADPGTSGDVAKRPISKESEAIIKEIAVRRRTAMEILANR